MECVLSIYHDDLYTMTYPMLQNCHVLDAKHFYPGPEPKAKILSEMNYIML